MTLWHRTCPDSAEMIGDRGILIPHRHPLVGAPLVWLADRPGRSRASLGLTSWTLSCDRMAALYRVDDHEAAIPWLLWASDHGVKPGLLGSGDPRCWWVSGSPLSAERVR